MVTVVVDILSLSSISAGVTASPLSTYSAAQPATIGDAIEVPLSSFVPPSCWFATMPTPGAKISVSKFAVVKPAAMSLSSEAPTATTFAKQAGQPIATASLLLLAEAKIVTPLFRRLLITALPSCVQDVALSHSTANRVNVDKDRLMTRTPNCGIYGSSQEQPRLQRH